MALPEERPERCEIRAGRILERSDAAADALVLGDDVSEPSDGDVVETSRSRRRPRLLPGSPGRDARPPRRTSEVGEAGFEPAISCPPDTRPNQTRPLPVELRMNFGWPPVRAPIPLTCAGCGALTSTPPDWRANQAAPRPVAPGTLAALRDRADRGRMPPEAPPRIARRTASGYACFPRCGGRSSRLLLRRDACRGGR